MGFIKEQIKLIKTKDPAIKNSLEVFLYPSFKVLLYHKIAHQLYLKKHFFLARWLAERAKRKTGIEIHPGAIIGKNFFIDHGCGTVIGETAIIKNNVTLYHGVTLGGTKNIQGKRHPTIENNVLIGCNATILGNVTIGENTKIGANAFVRHSIKKNKIVYGKENKAKRPKIKK